MSIPSNKPFALTQEQIQFFNVFGYLVFPGLFKEEAKEISHAFNRVVERHSHEITNHFHEAHYENRRKIIYRFIEKDPYLLELIGDTRIQGIGKGLVGENFNYTGGDGNVFTGDTIWHRDSYGVVRHHRYIKIAFYLEEIDGDCGGFRLLPGSHHQGQPFSKSLHSVFPNEKEILGINADEVPGQIVPTNPGDVVVFDLFLQHATCHSRFPRRMFNLVLTEHFNPRKQEQFIDQLAQGLYDASTSDEISKNPSGYHEDTLFTEALWNHPNPDIHRRLTQPHEMEQEARRRVRERINQDKAAGK